LKAVFVPLLVPFFNFRNEFVGAVRIYYGVVISHPYITLSCSTETILRKFLGNNKKEELYGYCEIKENPTLGYAVNYALAIYFGNANIIKRINNVYSDLYSTDGAIIVKPKSIHIEEYLFSNDVLLLSVNLGTSSLNDIVYRDKPPHGQRTFTGLSREYSEAMCNINDIVRKTSGFSLCVSCYKSTVNYLVKRNNLSKLIRALIRLGIDADSLKVAGLFSRKHVVYVKSPHVQKTSCTT